MWETHGRPSYLASPVLVPETFACSGPGGRFRFGGHRRFHSWEPHSFSHAHGSRSQCGSRGQHGSHGSDSARLIAATLRAVFRDSAARLSWDVQSGVASGGLGHVGGGIGRIVYGQWKQQHAHDWFTFNCPLTTMRNPELRQREKAPECCPSHIFKLHCRRAIGAFPNEPRIAPMSTTELREFDTRRWCLGVPPEAGILLRTHNVRESSLCWP